jgi:hypothetical protein
MTEAGASETATVKMLLSGYAHALQRLQDAIGYTDAVGTFRAFFESLNWASPIDDRIGEHWAPEGQPLSWKWRERVAGAELMAGVRFARNRVHHQWVDAIYFNEAGGLTFPVTFPLLSRRTDGVRSLNFLGGTTTEGARYMLSTWSTSPWRRPSCTSDGHSSGWASSSNRRQHPRAVGLII